MIHFFIKFSTIFGAMLGSNSAMLGPCWGYVGVKLNIFGIFGYLFTILFNMCSRCSNLKPNLTSEARMPLLILLLDSGGKFPVAYFDSSSFPLSSPLNPFTGSEPAEAPLHMKEDETSRGAAIAHSLKINCGCADQWTCDDDGHVTHDPSESQTFTL